MTFREEKLYEQCPMDLGWIENVMMKHYPDNRWKNASIKKLDQEGFMAYLRRITIEYDRDINGNITSEENYDSPVSKVLIKIPNFVGAGKAWEASGCVSGENLVKQADMIVTNMMETENDCYKILTKYHEAYQIPIPKIFCSIDGRQTTPNEVPVLIMEEIQDVKIVDVIEGFTSKQLYAIIDIVIRLHALTIIEKIDNPARPDARWESIPVPFKCMVDTAIDSIIEKDPSTIAILLEKVFKESYKDMDWSATKTASIKEKPQFKTLNHGDCWQTNILMDANDNDKIKGLIDWQLAEITNPFVDICHLLFSCVPVVIRRKQQSEIFKYYYKNLKLTVESKGKEVGFSYEELKEVFIDALPYNVGRNVFALIMWRSSPLCKTGKDDEEFRTNELNSRLSAMLEDIIDNSFVDSF
uniref:CHK domain-containing protein n=1 Tax=Rhabditophanes sp. KR3021 TaxID=114890 RepID=A0AC35TQ85_9BILA